MKLRLLACSLIAALWTSGAPLLAHHGNRAAYGVSTAEEVTLSGVVTQYKWGNPHVYILFDVADGKGNTVHWSAETHPPYVMAKSGWSRTTLKPGDKVAISLFPSKMGAAVGLLSKVAMDGRLLFDDEQERLQSGPQ